eukprot:s4996_g3.t1
MEGLQGNTQAVLVFATGWCRGSRRGGVSMWVCFRGHGCRSLCGGCEQLRPGDCSCLAGGAPVVELCRGMRHVRLRVATPGGTSRALAAFGLRSTDPQFILRHEIGLLGKPLACGPLCTLSCCSCWSSLQPTAVRVQLALCPRGGSHCRITPWSRRT